jgi:hypothetical protein
MTLCFFVRANPFSPTRWHCAEFQATNPGTATQAIKAGGYWVRQRSKADGQFTTAICRKGI